MQASGCVVIRQSQVIAVVGTYLIGCAVLLVGFSGAGSEAPGYGRFYTARPRRGRVLAILPFVADSSLLARSGRGPRPCEGG
jgi:hypothetical protein